MHPHRPNAQCPRRLLFATLGVFWLCVGHVEAASTAATLVTESANAMRTDPEQSRRYAEEALQQLQKQPDADVEIRARLQLCDYFAERDRVAAEEQIRIAKGRMEAAKREGLGAGILNCEGAIYETAGDNPRARDLYEQAVTIATHASDDEMLAEALYSRGYIRALQGQYALGLSDLQRSQSLFERLNMSEHALNSLNSIATLYNRLGEYQEAVHIFERALAAQRKQHMRREEAVTLHNLARAQENLQDWDAARGSFAAARAICQELKYVRGEAYALRGLAAVANATGEPGTGLNLLDEAARLQQQTPDARLDAQIQLARGISLHQLQRLPESAAALENAQRIFSAANSLNELSSTYSELAAVYAAMGNWRRAYEVRASAQTTSNRVLREQLDQRFATLKIEFDSASKDQENALLLRENAANQRALEQSRTARKLQTAVIILSAALIVLLGVLLWHQRRDRMRNHQLAMTDELTGVPNRRAVMAHLDRQMQRGNCAVLIIDIDHFKSINDQFGHHAGDETLKLVAQELKRASIAPATCGRLGGEEFMLLLPELSLAAAIIVAEQLRVAIANIDLQRWCTGRALTASIGVATSHPAGEPSNAVLRRADAALYHAKHAGRNCVSSMTESEPEAVPLIRTASGH